MSKRLWKVTVNRAGSELCEFDHDKLTKKVLHMVKRELDGMFEDDARCEFLVEIQAVRTAAEVDRQKEG